MSEIAVALQLYTVRDHMAKDYVGTLRKVKEIGYDYAQFGTDAPFDGPGLRQVIDEIGLKPAGIHVAWNEMEKRLDHWIAFAKAIGTKDLVIPWWPEERRRTKEDWLAGAASMDKLGAQCKAKGIRLSYHNHSFEFIKFGNTYALDLLYKNTSPDHLYTELDTYWIKHGGADPVAFVLKYAGREPTLHIKDMAADEKRSFAEIGKGILDWPAIHKASLKGGVEYYCVEQDICPGDSLESARISFEFVSKLVAS